MNKDSENSKIFFQIFDTVDIGLIILDRDLRVLHWNHWLQLHSEIPPDKIIGSLIYDIFPNLKAPWFLKSCKVVLTFGNFNYFSQRLHSYLFPFKPISSLDSQFEFMQQSCTMGPLRNAAGEIEYIFISIHDVTEIVNFEKKMLEMNMKDALTGSSNRRYLELRLKEEVERHKRYTRQFSLIMFDIDFFKNINDSYGHQCGDYILAGIASTIGKIIRDQDILGRYGGDEFCCLLPETSLDAAIIVAERFRKTIDQKAFNFNEQPIKVTISLGVATLNNEVSTPEQLLKNADAGLYEAKNTSRNCVAAIK